MSQKSKHLILGLIMDAIGYFSYAFPFIGEGIDFIWAPISAYIMMKMYKGTEGKIGGAIQFIEEALPFTDVVPTYTIMWIYKYVLKKDTLEADKPNSKSKKKEVIIDI